VNIRASQKHVYAAPQINDGLNVNIKVILRLGNGGVEISFRFSEARKGRVNQ
jgi:hypothetical protein